MALGDLGWFSSFSFLKESVCALTVLPTCIMSTCLASFPTPLPYFSPSSYKMNEVFSGGKKKGGGSLMQGRRIAPV